MVNRKKQALQLFPDWEKYFIANAWKDCRMNLFKSVAFWQKSRCITCINKKVANDFQNQSSIGFYLIICSGLNYYTDKTGLTAIINLFSRFAFFDFEACGL